MSTVFTYNHLNLPQTATRTGTSVSYVSDAMGTKLTKNATMNGVTSRQDYVAGIEYSAPNVIERIATEEGYLLNSNGAYSFHYYLTDHLGNNRVVLKKGTSLTVPEIIQRQDYYAFGKTRSLVTSGNNRYLYNGKEVQKELADQLDYGARFYDAEIGRWNVIDPMAHKGPGISPYTISFNNPLMFVDPNGAWPWSIWARSFISASSVGRGTFRGDGRGPSLGIDKSAISRTWETFTFDPQNQKIVNLNVDADLTVFYGIKGVGETSEKPKPTASFTGVSTTKNSLGNDIGTFGFSYSAKDPVTPDLITPLLDVHSTFSITENLKTGTLFVNSSFTGDVFPSTEAFISDQSGAKLFLGAREETGGILYLYGDNKKSLFTVDMQIKFDEKGNFTGVQQGDKLINVADWNKQVQSQFEKK